jgi:hypothetical protein
MTYDKPKVVKLDSAIKAVQMVGKGKHYQDEMPPYLLNATVNAYESDE